MKMEPMSIETENELEEEMGFKGKYIYKEDYYT